MWSPLFDWFLHTLDTSNGSNPIPMEDGWGESGRLLVLEFRISGMWAMTVATSMGKPH
jgi:hypothetical protein